MDLVDLREYSREKTDCYHQLVKAIDLTCTLPIVSGTVGRKALGRDCTNNNELHRSLKSKQDLKINQRTNGRVNAHLISLPSKAQNIQNL